MDSSNSCLVPDPRNKLIALSGGSLSTSQDCTAKVCQQMELVFQTTSTEERGVFHGLHIFECAIGCNSNPVIQLVGLWILAASWKQEYFVPRRNRKDRLPMEKNLQSPVLFVIGFNLFFSEAPG